MTIMLGSDSLLYRALKARVNRLWWREYQSSGFKIKVRTKPFQRL